MNYQNTYRSITIGSVILVVLLLFSSCTKRLNKLQNNNDDLNHLTEMMTGSFNSLFQSKADTNFYNIHLEMVRIWPERKDTNWLYVEQAASWALDKPYRQRVYRLTKESDDIFKSAVFSIEDPLRFAGDFSAIQPLDGIYPDSLLEREGCAIYMTYENGYFKGSTKEKECKSTLRGASYATSEVKIAPGNVISWDRGYDDMDKQVWGAVSGPYVFDRVD